MRVGLSRVGVIDEAGCAGEFVCERGEGERREEREEGDLEHSRQYIMRPMRDPRFDLWRDRSLRFSMGAGTTIVSGLTGVLRNKWFAHHLEASGIGVLAQVISSEVWLGTAAGMGMGLPVARAVGASLAQNDTPAARRAVWAAFSLLAIGVSVVVTLGLVFAEAISSALLGSGAYAALIRISMIGVAGVALQQTLFGLYAGRSDLRAPLTFALLGGAVSIAATLLLVPRWGLKGAALAVAILFPVGCASALWIHRRTYAPVLERPPGPLLSSALARTLLTISGAGLVSGLVEQGTFLTLRSHYVRMNGIEANGFLQAGLAISQQVGALFYSYLASYAFGKISGAAQVSGAEGARVYTRKHWAPLLVFAAVALLATRLLALPLLHILYSHRFDPAEPLMAWALVGEFGRISLITVSLGALPVGGVKLWFPISLVFPATLATAYAAFTASGAGPLSLPKAYAVAGLTAALVGGVLMGRRGVTLRARDLAVFAAGAAGLFLLALSP